MLSSVRGAVELQLSSVHARTHSGEVPPSMCCWAVPEQSEGPGPAGAPDPRAHARRPRTARGSVMFILI